MTDQADKRFTDEFASEKAEPTKPIDGKKPGTVEWLKAFAEKNKIKTKGF